MCLVDDDLAVLKSIGRLLTSGGLAVRVFSKPADFLTHVQAHSVPLVVLDILMEGMSGLEVQAQLTRGGIRLPVIAGHCWSGACQRRRSVKTAR